MTEKEAECYLAMKRWQRMHLKKQMSASFLPKFPLFNLFQRSGAVGKLVICLVNIIVLPFTLLWWCIRIFNGLFFYPLWIALTHIKPKSLRGPGERNIKGLHYQFASHIELPIDTYISCVNEWTSLLYGADKLPKYRLENYLDEDYLQRRNATQGSDPLIEQMLKTQISNAREELSRDLGHY